MIMIILLALLLHFSSLWRQMQTHLHTHTYTCSMLEQQSKSTIERARLTNELRWFEMSYDQIVKNCLQEWVRSKINFCSIWTVDHKWPARQERAEVTLHLSKQDSKKELGKVVSSDSPNILFEFIGWSELLRRTNRSWNSQLYCTSHLIIKKCALHCFNCEHFAMGWASPVPSCGAGRDPWPSSTDMLRCQFYHIRGSMSRN